MSVIPRVAGVPIPTSASNKYTCVNCKVGFESTSEQRLHFKTEWHLYNLKRKVCKLEPIDLESFKKIQVLAPEVAPPTKGPKVRSKFDPNEQTYEDRLNEKKLILSGAGNVGAAAAAAAAHDDGDHDDDDEDDWEEIDDEELLDEDYDEDEVEEMLSRVVKPNTCLFCDTKSSNTKDNILHMNLRHGFFIPEEQYLIDRAGLMEYLGFKVGAGLTCLWCSKQFTTLHGVRLHMLYKDHCKIFYDQDKAMTEFRDFYDYSSQIQIAMKPINELVVTKKKRTRDAPSSLVKLSNKNSRQLVASSASAAVVAQAYHSKRSIKKFNAERAKTLLHIGMTNNNAMRGRIRQQNPM